MAYVRWLHPNEFLPDLGRFPSSVLRNLGGSLSLVDCECVLASGTALCDHARIFYLQTNTVSEPPIYWKFDAKLLPPCERIEAVPTKSGDLCHRNVHGIANKTLKSFFKYSDPVSKTVRDLSEFTICTENGSRPLSLSDIPPKEIKTENNA